MKKEVMGKIERTKGKDVKGGSTKARIAMASSMEKAMTRKGERDEMKKSDKVNKVTAGKTKGKY